MAATKREKAQKEGQRKERVQERGIKKGRDCMKGGEWDLLSH